MEMFRDLAGSYNICIAEEDSVASNDEDMEFDRVVDNLKKAPNASVVVCFCEGHTVRRLLQAMVRKGVDGKFMIIGR
jgi:citrate lyase beta subunit